MYHPRWILTCIALAIGVFLYSENAHAADDAGQWQLAKQGREVTVWKRFRHDGGVAEFRAETTVNSTLSGLLALMYDVEGAPAWLDHTRRVSVLKRDDIQQEYVLRIETSLPWPLSDRDAIIVGRWWQEPSTLAIKLRGKSVDGLFPVSPAYVRQYIRADWTFIPVDTQRVRVVMEGEAQPGGNLPVWAVNLLIQESPYQTLRNLHAAIAQKKYQDAVFANVVEWASAGSIVQSTAGIEN